MIWKNIRLGDSATFINGYAFKPNQWDKEGLEIIRIQNLTGSSKEVNYFQGEIDDRYKVTKGDLLISWSGTLGVFKWKRSDGWLNQHIFKVVFDKEEVDKSFFAHLINQKLDFLARETHGSTMKHITKKRFDNLKIPLPPFPIQQKIAEVLDTADRIRRRNQQVLEKYDQLAQSVFLEMFGDFSHKSGRLISDYAEIVSGVTKDSKINGEDTVEVPYMRVANVQDGFIDLDEIKLIRVKLRDVSRFRLLKGDILLTEGGDPDKLGRGAVWQYEIENCIHQNHIFRVRLDEKELNPIYTSYLLGSSYGKKYFLKAAKQTTGIASINITQLKKFPIIVPPLALQNQFESIIEKMEQQKQQAKAELDKSEELFQSLMQRAFPQADKVGGS